MPYKPPTLNLMCNIWRALGVSPLPPDPAVPPMTTRCQLRMSQVAFVESILEQAEPIMQLKVPKGFDIRASNWTEPAPDLVEVPANSGRFYTVLAVDDVAKGFPTEYRVAAIRQRINDPFGWPFPTP